MASNIEYAKDRCFTFEKRHFKDKPKNETQMPVIFRGYKRTPEIFAATFVLGIAIIVSFAFLRKKAWNYGRLALLHRKRSTWYKWKTGYNVFQRINFFDVDSEDQEYQALAAKKMDASKNSAPTHSFQHSSKPASEETDSVDKRDKKPSRPRKPTEQRVLHIMEQDDNGHFSWIRITFALTDDDLKLKCGQEAVYYAMFQRMIMLYFLILLIVYAAVLIPIHLYNDYVSDEDKFGRLTINNIPPDSEFLWAHCTLLVASVIFFVLLLRRLVANLGPATEDRILPAVMVTNMPRAVAGNAVIVRKYFMEAYPYYRVRNVNFAYDVERYMANVVHLKNASSALNSLERSRDDPLIRISGADNKVFASEYYSNEKEKYKALVAASREIARKSPLAICFVTFSDMESVANVVKDFAWCSILRLFENVTPGRSGIKCTSVDDRLRPRCWFLSWAPDPCDVQWENLATQHWYPRAVLFNILALLFLFFLTTPSLVTKVYFTINHSLGVNIRPDQVYNHFVFELIPVGLFVIFTLILPNVIWLVEYVSNHWTKSAENICLLRKCTIFLLLMVLVLPSIGLTSMYTTIRFVSEEERHHKNRTIWDQFECAFMADTGAFFFSYTSTSAFVSVPIDLIQINVLLKYAWRRFRAKSKFEKYKIILDTIPDFQYGEHYSWMLLFFTIVVVFAPMVPVIIIPGLICFTIKYYIDRYTMFFACKPGKMTRDQHLTALNFTLFSFLLSLFILCLFLTLRTKGDAAWNWRNATMIIIFLCMVCIYIFQLSFGWLFTGVLSNILVPMDEDQLESAKSLETSKTLDPSPSTTDQPKNTVNDAEDKFITAAAASPSKKAPHLPKIQFSSTNVGSDAYNSPFRRRNVYEDYRIVCRTAELIMMRKLPKYQSLQSHHCLHMDLNLQSLYAKQQTAAVLSQQFVRHCLDISSRLIESDSSSKILPRRATLHNQNVQNAQTDQVDVSTATVGRRVGHFAHVDHSGDDVRRPTAARQSGPRVDLQSAGRNVQYSKRRR